VELVVEMRSDGGEPEGEREEGMKGGRDGGRERMVSGYWRPV
jgi:hypothetical protein